MNSSHPHPHECVGSIYIGWREALALVVVVSCTHLLGLARSWLCPAGFSDPQVLWGEAGAAHKPLGKWAPGRLPAVWGVSAHME